MNDNKPTAPEQISPLVRQHHAPASIGDIVAGAETQGPPPSIDTQSAPWLETYSWALREWCAYLPHGLSDAAYQPYTHGWFHTLVTSTAQSALSSALPPDEAVRTAQSLTDLAFHGAVELLSTFESNFPSSHTFWLNE